jgi:glutathione S-transferase
VPSPILTINSRNYGAWSLRGWLLCRLAGLDFKVEVVGSEDPGARAELLLLSPSFLVPRLSHAGCTVWDTIAIGEYLNETFPNRGLLPLTPAERARCRSICGEAHSGFASLRAALPMNLRAHYPGFSVWAAARSDIDRIEDIWTECLGSSGGPFLFGSKPNMADAMYAPEVTRLRTYDIKVSSPAAQYVESVLALPDMQEWAADALAEPEDVAELEIEF